MNKTLGTILSALRERGVNLEELQFIYLDETVRIQYRAGFKIVDPTIEAVMDGIFKLKKEFDEYKSWLPEMSPEQAEILEAVKDAVFRACDLSGALLQKMPRDPNKPCSATEESFRQGLDDLNFALLAFKEQHMFML